MQPPRRLARSGAFSVSPAPASNARGHRFRRAAAFAGRDAFAAACHDRNTAALTKSLRASCAPPSSPSSPASASSSPTCMSPISSASTPRRWRSPASPPSTVFQSLGLYNMAALSSAHRQLPRLLLGWTVTVGLLLAGLFFLKVAPEFSRAWLALWYASVLVALVAYRGVVAALTRRGLAQGQLTRRAIVYGTGPACESLLQALDADPTATSASAASSTTAASTGRAPTIAGHANLGNLDALMAFCRRTPIDMLIVALPVSAETRVLQLIKKLWVLPVDIRLAAQASQLRFRPRDLLLRRYRAADRYRSTGRSPTGMSCSSGCSTRAWPCSRCWASPR